MKQILKMLNPFKENNSDMPVALYIIKKLLAYIIILIVATFLAEAVAIIVFYILGYNALRGDIPSFEVMTLVKYYGFSVFMILTMLYCKFIEKRSLKSMGFCKDKAITGYLKGIIVAVVVLGATIGIAMLTGALYFEGFSNNINMPLTIAFLGGFIVQGAMEEVMCRGFLMSSLLKKTSLSITILVSSLAFAAPHFPTLFSGGILTIIIGCVNLLLFPIFMSLYMIKDGNIWVSCAIHSSWNFLLGIVCGINVSGGENTLSILTFTSNESKGLINGGNYGLEAGIITTAILTICISILIFKMKRKSKMEFRIVESMKDFKY